MSSNFPIIEEKVNRAARKVLRNDLFLLRIKAHELAIAHKFAENLQQEFPDWHVDFDYNRREEDTKQLGNKEVRPDIIVHIRDIKNNLLIIEIKKSDDSRSEKKSAKDRVKEFTIDEQYEYEYGLFILFNVKEKYREEPTLEWFKDGKKICSKKLK